MEERVLQAKKEFSLFGMALFVIAVLTIVLQLLVAVVWRVVPADSPIASAEIMSWILTMAPLYLVAIPVGFLLIRKIPAEMPPKQSLSFGRFMILMLICMPIMYGGNLLGNMLSSLFSGGNAENALLDYIMGNPLYSFIFTVLLAPFIEEFLFRKQIIDRLGKYGEKTAILFSAVTFGLFHMNLFQFFYAFGLGLIFAYVYTRTRMLRYPVLMHMIINFMGGVIAPLLLNMLDMEVLNSPNGATTEQIMQMLPGLLAYLGYLFVLLGSSIAGLVLLIIRWQKRRFFPASRQLPWGTERKAVYGNVGVILFFVVCLIMIVLALL